MWIINNFGSPVKNLKSFSPKPGITMISSPLTGFEWRGRSCNPVAGKQPIRHFFLAAQGNI
ncbi:hypothetical protein DDZ16_13340 [Marinilabilia rubra]|uniref:Uncharacterized protein n=1 Tax=Marinilabilia rubra TaxID=2162893 RepID=A0A2U2B7E8_9BACT|nr:hypothetical protein DDZ16_13340 [Marinilabilia rubra]